MSHGLRVRGWHGRDGWLLHAAVQQHGRQLSVGYGVQCDDGLLQLEAMGSQYDSQRRVTKVPAVERTSGFDGTARLDLGRRKKFEEALERTADSVRQSRQKRDGRTFDAATQRLKRKG